MPKCHHSPPGISSDHISRRRPFRIHDLIQLFVLEDAKRSGLESELFEFAVNLACAAFSKIEDVSLPEWWPPCELVVPHIYSLTLRQDPDTSNDAKKALLQANHCRGVYPSSRGRFTEAQSLYENIMVDREQLFNLGNLEALTVMHNSAWVLESRGCYVDAETLFKRVLDSRKTRFGPEYRDMLNQTLQSQESQFGAENEDTLFTMTKLAEVYESQERYDEAESLLTRVLQGRENLKLLGSDYRETLYTKHALANVYFWKQQYNTAAALFLQVLCAWERDLGPQHPDTLVATYSLACVYASQGRYGDAENLFGRVLAAEERIRGLSQPMTVKELASVYKMPG